MHLWETADDVFPLMKPVIDFRGLSTPFSRVKRSRFNHLSATNLLGLQCKFPAICTTNTVMIHVLAEANSIACATWRLKIKDTKFADS